MGQLKLSQLAKPSFKQYLSHALTLDQAPNAAWALLLGVFSSKQDEKETPKTLGILNSHAVAGIEI